MPDETWKPIPGIPHYEASDLGRIRRVDHTTVDKNGRNRNRTGCIIAPWSHSGNLRTNVGGRNRYVAALVLEAHGVPRPSSHCRIRYADGDRTNTALSNISWLVGETPRKAPKPAAPNTTPRPAQATLSPITIDLTGLPMMSPNGRPNPFAKARDTRSIRQSVAFRARAANIPTGLAHITIAFHYRPAEDRYRWDTRNLAAAGIWKAAQDALHAHRGRTDSGYRHPVVHDDTDEFMTEIAPVQHPAVKGKPAATWLVISWTEDAAEVAS